MVVYKFDQFSIILGALHITDSVLDFPSANATWPDRHRKLTAQGDLLRIYVTANLQPFFQPVRTVKLNKNHNESSEIMPEDLEFKIDYPEDLYFGNWKDIRSYPLLEKDSPLSLFPFSPGTLPLTKGKYFKLRQQANMVYPGVEASIRNKKTKEEVIRFQIRGIDEPLSPFLILATQEESNKKIIDSFHKVRENLIALPNIDIKDGQVIDKEPSKQPDIPKMLNYEPFYKTSELVLYFNNERGYPDSSLEFRLLSKSISDTSWKKTGHRLVIPQLVAGDQYRIQVRYEFHPSDGQEHTIYVVPQWYQTTQTKIIFAGVLLLGGLLTWLFIYRRQLTRSRRRREQLSLEVKAIRSQLNPHFIFNAMSSIQGLINKNEISAANRYLTEFSSLLRDTLHNSEKEMVPLVSEAHLLDSYLNLEQLRFGFNYTISIDEAIDKNGTEIPNLLLQPLVENAVKHGAGPLGEKGLISIAFIKREQDMLVSITDNGRTFNVSREAEGYGLKLTRNRISLLAQTLREQPIELTIERKQDRETIVHLAFKNWL
ncbi:sensor histidine kinase [Paraflavitalea pollutisoli]|uniref:sensor histidine kinase n=1 Tax=Paraflavitalea pollutisoli TaxID=3034143 RepID=UPI0023EDE616|nr:histidine kinase [Paraflavitalea sp. H1-2-19X]